MTTYQSITEKLIAWFNSNANINEVTFGDFNEVDLSTHTDFPLVHIVPLATNYLGQTIAFNYQIILFDKMHDTDTSIIPLSNMEHVAREFMNYCYLNKYEIRSTIGQLTIDPVYDQRINRLYGWSFGNVAIVIPNIEC